MSKLKKHLPTALLVIAFCTGLCLLLYPTVSNFWNGLHQSRAIADYARMVKELNRDAYAEVWESAEAYNAKLAETGPRLVMTEEELEEYGSQLNADGSGLMGYVEIPVINCSLPVYHGTDEAVLQVAAGHLAGTSLPVGGAGTHCVISGHTGLPSAKLFSGLDKLAVGDLFMLHVLDETLTYEVDQVLTVLPDELDALAIEEGKDLCTLMTCTPYGINSHRLLVRGHRVADQELAQAAYGASARRKGAIVLLCLAAAALLVLLVLLVARRRRKKG